MRWMIPAFVFVVSAVLGHYIVLTSIPGFIMSKAHQTFETQGVPQYAWIASPRQTPDTQRVVRPSPDMAYSICRFDTTTGPVFISAPGWDGYGSLSIFNDQTDNVFVADLGADSGFEGIEVRRPAENTSAGALIVDGRGIALVRRLAPTADAYDRATSLVADSVCERID